MSGNKNELPKRKRIRLKDYDYSQNGYYFITVCTKERQALFWESVGADSIRPELSGYGKIVNEAINSIPVYYPIAKVDEYVIMPDHIHMIIKILNSENTVQISATSKPIKTIVGQMKRWVSKEIGYSIWQKSYYEHIIRDDNDYITRVEYILNNPLKRILKNNDNLI